MSNLKNGLHRLYRNSILNTKKKKYFIYGILFYYPVATLLFGSPFPDFLKNISIPFHLFTLDPISVQLVETLSTVLSIIGTISIGVFWIHRTSNSKHEETRNDVKELDTKIDRLDDKLCLQLNEKFTEVLKKMDAQKIETERLFNEKMNNVQLQIINLKEVDTDIKHRMTRLDDNIYRLRNPRGGDPD